MCIVIYVLRNKEKSYTDIQSTIILLILLYISGIGNKIEKSHVKELRYINAFYMKSYKSNEFS